MKCITEEFLFLRNVQMQILLQLWPSGDLILYNINVFTNTRYANLQLNGCF